MVVYVVELYDPHVFLKTNKMEILESYIIERNIISRVKNIFYKKEHPSIRWDDDFIVKVQGHALTNREVHYLADKMLEFDSYIENLKILRKENKKDLHKKEVESIKYTINQLERKKVRDRNMNSYIGDILDNPCIVNEYMTNLEMFHMLMEDDNK